MKAMLRDLEDLAAQRRFHALSKATNAVVWRAAPDGAPLEARRWPELSGRPKEWRAHAWLDDLHPDDQARVGPLWHLALATGEVFEAVFRLRQQDGGYRWALGRGIPIKDADGTVSEWVGTVTDVYEQRQAVEDLARSEERLTLAVETAELAIWDFDLVSGRVWWADGKYRLLGIADDNPISDETFWGLVHPDDRAPLATLRNKAFRPEHDGKFDAEFRIRRADTGAERWVVAYAQVLRDAEQRPYRVLGTLQDITRQRQQQELLFHLAYYDQLTGLPNQLLLAERAEAVIESGYAAAVLMIDLDGFQSFNDTAGSSVGDELLKLVAARLVAAAGDGNILARVGGDEFAILLPRTGAPEIVAELAEKIQDAFTAPFKVANRVVFVAASIGIAIAPIHGSSAEAIIAHANLALHQAKQEGGNPCRFFTSDLHEASQARQGLETELRRAFNGYEFELHFQPQLRLVDRKLTGFEALLRWRHPDRGLLAHAEFLAVLERSALAQAVGEWGLDTACAEAAELARQGLRLRMAVNLFQAQINASLPETIGRVLFASGLAPALLEIELTENVILGSDKSIIAVLNSLRAQGVGIALDDYGTGYASLSMLKQLPVTRLKIDRSFVQNLVVNPGDAAILEAILSLGQNFRLAVTAEGIATEEHEAALLRGCEEGQGFLYSEARPLRDLTEWLETAPAASLPARGPIAL